MSASQEYSGLTPVRHRHGGTIRSQALVGGIASGYGTAIYAGDPIKLVTGGTFEVAAKGEAISGVFAGWLPEDGGVWQISHYWPANTTWTNAPTVFFFPGRDLEFMIQGEGSIAQTAIGDAADINLGTGNAKSGRSGAFLDSDTLAGAASSAQCKILDLYRVPGNTWGDSYTKVIVAINELNLGFEPGNAI